MPRRPAKSSGAQAERSAADGGDGGIDVKSDGLNCIIRLEIRGFLRKART